MIPVLDKNKKPLMPCSEKRARKLMEKGEAKPYWYKGVFSIILQREPKTDYKQNICVGVDPGSKMSALTIKTEAHTLLNVQYSAPTHVKRKVAERMENRKVRRQRKTPYRQMRFNRSVGKRLSPSTKSRWQQHYNLIQVFNKLYPINIVAIEDIQAKSIKKTIKGARRWNTSFSPLQIGKNWFYGIIQEEFELYVFAGYDTYNLRHSMNLEKGKDKLKVEFKAHCVDSWVMANQIVGGHTKPENTKLIFIKPFNHQRRKLHRQLPKKGIRHRYGGTMSYGFKKGTLVKHPVKGLCLTGGSNEGKVVLHCLKTNKNLYKHAKAKDLKILTNIKYNIKNI